MPEAQEQLRQMQNTMNGEQFRECLLIARLGFDHGFQAATFTLGPGDWIGFDLTRDTHRITATISRDGKDTRREVPVLPGTRFLPFEHIELMTGADRRTRRHFIEFFHWFPSQSGQWSLGWRLLEVVRDDLVSVADALLVTTSAEPPAELTSELRQSVHLRVNNRGDAEWEVLGSHPQRGVIETEVERREEREESELRRLRREADARVVWTRTRDVYDAPMLAYSDADGCGHLFVYGWSDDRTEAITVQRCARTPTPRLPRFQIAGPLRLDDSREWRMPCRTRTSAFRWKRPQRRATPQVRPGSARELTSCQCVQKCSSR